MTTRDAIDGILRDFRRELHTCFPALVLAYDVTAQTVDVQPAIQREMPSDAADESFQTEELPILYAVPVQWPRGGGGALTFPIIVGDWVQVHCAEQSLLAWRAVGGVGVTPGIDDPHGLNGAIAVPGWFPDSEKLSGVSALDVELRTSTAGNVVLGGQTGAQFVALANLVLARLNVIETAFNAHVHVVSVPITGPAGTTAGTSSPTVAPITPTTTVAATKVKAR